MTTKLSLSIGIPMYNHERTIRTTLDSIFSQLDDIKDICDLEVVISDNCSTDKSPEIIKTEYLPKYPEILKYYRNEENIGMSGNFSKVFELSISEYVWCFGDDVVLANTLYYVTNNLHNAIKYKNDINCVTSIPADKDNNQNTVSNTVDYKVYNNIYDFLNNATLYSFNCSCFIISRAKYMMYIDQINHDFFHPQNDVIFKIARNGGVNIFLPQRFIITSPRTSSALNELRMMFGAYILLKKNKIDYNLAVSSYNIARNVCFSKIRNLRIRHIMSSLYQNDQYKMIKFIMDNIVQTKFLLPSKHLRIIRFLNMISHMFALLYLYLYLYITKHA